MVRVLGRAGLKMDRMSRSEAARPNGGGARSDGRRQTVARAASVSPEGPISRSGAGPVDSVSSTCRMGNGSRHPRRLTGCSSAECRSPPTAAPSSPHHSTAESNSNVADGTPIAGMRVGKPRSIGQTKIDEQGAIQSDQIVISKPAEPIAQIGTRHGGDLVDHDVTRVIEASRDARSDGKPGERRLNQIRGQWTHSDRGRGVESVILNNDDGARLTGVGASRSRDMDIAATHRLDSISSPHSPEMASTKA